MSSAPRPPGGGKSWLKLVILAVLIGGLIAFFALGGHSLLLAELQVRLQEELEVDVSIVEMFQYPTIAGLAAHLKHGRSAASDTDSEQRRRRSRNMASGRRALRQRRGNRE